MDKINKGLSQRVNLAGVKFALQLLTVSSPPSALLSLAFSISTLTEPGGGRAFLFSWRARADEEAARDTARGREEHQLGKIGC